MGLMLISFIILNFFSNPYIDMPSTQDILLIKVLFWYGVLFCAWNVIFFHWFIILIEKHMELLLENFCLKFGYFPGEGHEAGCFLFFNGIFLPFLYINWLISLILSLITTLTHSVCVFGTYYRVCIYMPLLLLLPPPLLFLIVHTQHLLIQRASAFVHLCHSTFLPKVIRNTLLATTLTQADVSSRNYFGGILGSIIPFDSFSYCICVPITG